MVLSLIPIESDLGQSSTEARRKQNRVRRFVCSEADRAAIERLVDRPVSSEALQSALAAAAEKASVLTLKAADDLRKSRRSPKTNQLFREAFGTLPSFIPSWRPAGATWDRGGIVRTRLRRAAQILNDGSIKYHCWGPSVLPSLTWKSTSTAFSAPGKYALYFGEAFWRAWQAGDEIKMAAVLLRKALYIYFGPRLTNVQGPKGFSNAFCYARYVLRGNDQPLPDTTERGCQQAVTTPAVTPSPPALPSIIPTLPEVPAPPKPPTRPKKGGINIVRIILIDPAGIFKNKHSLRADFISKLEDKFNNLDPTQLKKHRFRFRVEYNSGEPTSVEKANFKKLDFPVYLLGRQHGHKTVQNLMKQHKIPAKISGSDIYKIAEECWLSKDLRGCGIPSGVKGFKQVGFIKTHNVFDQASGKLWLAFVNATAHEIGHMGNVATRKHSDKGLMKYSAPLNRKIDFNALDKLKFIGNLARLRAI